MNLGLSGRRAIVCAASRGLGYACALALAREGVELVITGRDAAVLQRAAATIHAETGTAVRTAAGDITTPAGRAAALALLADPDILVNNAGGPPPGDFRDFSDADWQAALNANLLAPIAMIKAVVDPMIARQFGRIVNITSGAVKAPIPTLGLSNAARAGLTGFIAGLARQVAAHNVAINNLLPGAFATDRMAALAQANNRTTAEEIAARGKTNPTGRIGDPADFGAACAFLCSTHARYIIGQNWLLDGGAINTTL